MHVVQLCLRWVSEVSVIITAGFEGNITSISHP